MKRFFLFSLLISLFLFFYCGGGEEVKKSEFQMGSTEQMGGTGSKTIVAEGLAEVRQAGLAEAYERAEEAAKVKAIEKALGTIIDARILGSSGVILEENIYAKKQGYIKKFEVISKHEEDGIAYVTIKAEVGLQRLKDDVMALNILQQRMNMPKTIIFIQEENLGKPSKQKASYNVIAKKFREKEFTIISPSQITGGYKRNIKNLYKLMESDENAFIYTAGKLGMSVNADIVIVGKVTSQEAGKVMEGSKLISFQADVDFKVVNVGDGRIIASSSQHGAYPHISPISGGLEAIKKATAKAADDLIDQIIKEWENILNNGNLITLYVQGLSLTEEIKFEKLLKAYYREVRDVFGKQRQGNKSVFTVKFLGSPRDLAQAMTKKKSFPYKIDVLKYDFGQVTVRAKPKKL